MTMRKTWTEANQEQAEGRMERVKIYTGDLGVMPSVYLENDERLGNYTVARSNPTKQEIVLCSTCGQKIYQIIRYRFNAPVCERCCK